MSYLNIDGIMPEERTCQNNKIDFFAYYCINAVYYVV